MRRLSGERCLLPSLKARVQSLGLTELKERPTSNQVVFWLPRMRCDAYVYIHSTLEEIKIISKEVTYIKNLHFKCKKLFMKIHVLYKNPYFTLMHIYTQYKILKHTYLYTYTICMVFILWVYKNHVCVCVCLERNTQDQRAALVLKSTLSSSRGLRFDS